MYVSGKLEKADSERFMPEFQQLAKEYGSNWRRGLAHLGIQLDGECNLRRVDTISTPESSCRVSIIPMNEDLRIAWHTL